MKGLTHFSIGIATALVITHPQTVPGVVTAMAGGAFGSWIPDIDLRNRNKQSTDEEKPESIWDFLLKVLFLVAFIVLDFFAGRGMYQYIVDNWGVKVWGALFGIIILLLIGLNTKHRTFTHSLLAMAMFYGLTYWFCRPAAIPLLIGYASHLVLDLLNIDGPQLFFPIPWFPALQLCSSGNRKANDLLFWGSFAVNAIFGGFLFASGMMKADLESDFIVLITGKKVFGLNLFQMYLIFVNLVTFFGYRHDNKVFWEGWLDAKRRGVKYNHEEYETAMGTFGAWLLNILVFFGGGVGMLVFLLSDKDHPVQYNAKWWAFLYTSLLIWFTAYCYVCNPFGFNPEKIEWISEKSLSLAVYLLGINTVSALILFSLRKKRFEPDSLKHTLIFTLGSLGGTIGAILMVFYIRQKGKYEYVLHGFPFMLAGQIILIMYIMSAGKL